VSDSSRNRFDQQPVHRPQPLEERVQKPHGLVGLVPQQAHELGTADRVGRDILARLRRCRARPLVEQPHLAEDIALAEHGEAQGALGALLHDLHAPHADDVSLVADVAL
jgi:hypothetical protein